jgi:uncharacterized membrane protein
MHDKTTTEAVVAKAALFGVAGWTAENVLFGHRYSAMFKGHHVPFLPVYAAGGLAVMAAAPHIEKWPVLARAGAYALLGTAVEFAGCQLDRKLMEARSWDYGGSDALAKATDGCVDWKHTALWGVLGVIAEKTILK